MQRTLWTGSRWLSLVLLVLVTIVQAGCATRSSFVPERLIRPDHLTGVQTKQIEDVVVSVAILTDEQAQQHFGVDLGDNGLQALWMKVENGRNGRLWFIQNTLDPDLYTANEAALMMEGHVSKNEFGHLHQYFRDESMRVALKPRTVTEGFVFLPRVEGGRYVDIRLTGDAYEVGQARKIEIKASGKPSAIEIWETRFGFALPLPDGEFDYERLDTLNTYRDRELPDLDLEELRLTLEQLPCCATNEDGDANADPLNIVVVGEAHDLLNSLTRSGWSFTHRISLKSVSRMVGAAIRNEPYPIAPVSSLYLFDRKQDFALQRARMNISQRNHMRFWLAPFTYRNQQVWVGQISRDIGIKLSSKSPTLTTHIIDPEVDLAREYALHSLLAQGFVAKFGFATGSMIALREQPAYNLTDDPYFSDGMRLVIMLSRDPLPLVEIRSLQWEQSSAPIAEGQSEEAQRNVRPIEPED